MGVKLTVKGDLSKTKNYLDRLTKKDYYNILDSCGAEGVLALSSVTPIDSGVTSESWGYKIEQGKGKTVIVWTNSSQTSQGDSIVLLLQYGHGTGTGGYVVGRDFINPAIQPIFDNIFERVWEAVTSL